jgi:hypothetical protein
MRPGIDYKEIFAPTLKYTTLRILLSLVADMDYELHQIDVRNAFVNATVKENLYTEMPEGFSAENGDFVLKLVKALYGIHQAPREWYLLVSKFIVDKLGFTQCEADKCLFFKKSKTGRLILLAMFVDDFAIGFHKQDQDEWMKLKEIFLNRFKSTDFGEATHLLQMRITRDRSKRMITLDQEVYTTKKLEEFSMNNCSTVSTPAVPGAILDHAEIIDDNDEESQQAAENQPFDSHLYMQLVGALLYAAVSTRPDITYAVHQLTMHTQKPLRKHWTAGKRVLHYLQGTKDIGLRFGGNTLDETSLMNITGFSDADYANDKLDRKSITGWIVKLNGNVVSWQSKKQGTVALSTCEAELYATSACIQEVMWLQSLLKELGLKWQPASTVYGDNQSTIEICKNGIIREKTKHVDVKYKFITELLNKHQVQLQYIQTSEQQADILTKSLPKPLLEKHRQALLTR